MSCILGDCVTWPVGCLLSQESCKITKICGIPLAGCCSGSVFTILTNLKHCYSSKQQYHTLPTGGLRQMFI